LKIREKEDLFSLDLMVDYNQGGTHVPTSIPNIGPMNNETRRLHCNQPNKVFSRIARRSTLMARQPYMSKTALLNLMRTSYAAFEALLDAMSEEQLTTPVFDNQETALRSNK
jgi:hypothetical protein